MDERESIERVSEADDEPREDESAEIRYSLTALGEAVLAERQGKRFRGFGPCAAVA
jgi:hypothetical protein